MNDKPSTSALRPILLGLSLSILLAAKAGAAGIGHEVSEAAKAGGSDFGHSVAESAKATNAGRGNGDDLPAGPSLATDPGVPAMLFLSKNNGGDDLPPPPEPVVEPVP